MNSSMSQPRPPRPSRWNKPKKNRTSDSTPWIDGEISTNQSIFDLFLDVPEKSPRLGYECPIFRRVFGPTTLEDVHKGIYAPEVDSVWLYDMDENNNPRDYSGICSMTEFDERTKWKRIDENGMVNAVRRRIYISNPSPTAMSILALRSSYEQKQIIKQLLFDYLDASTSVGIKPSESDDFVLEFHMPCLIWQKGQPRREDSGRMTNGGLLRKTIDLSFLAASMDGSKTDGQGLVDVDYLYECQTSLVVTGWDISSWTAICLADSYFENQADVEDPYMLPHYAKDQDTPDFDPLSIGKLTADKKATVDPREYFLLIVKCRIMRLREEWTNVGHHLAERINEYVSKPSLLLRRQNTNLGTADEDSAAVESSEEWLKQIRNLLNRLMEMLETSVNILCRFLDRDLCRIDAQADESTSDYIRNSFDKISDYVEEFGKIFERFKRLKATVENFASQLETHIAVEGVRALKLQHLNVTILQVFSPMALAGSIVQAGIVVGNVVVWFFFLTLILAAVTRSLHPMRKWYEEWQGSRKQLTINSTQNKLEIETGSQATATGFSTLSCTALFRRRQARNSTDTLPR